MSTRNAPWSRWALLCALGLVLAASIAVRRGEGARDLEPVDAASADLEDPPTGALLVDLDDDADADDRLRVAALLARAIAPHAWPTGASALGVEMSDAAQLYRLSAPASEIADVIEVLGGDPDVEGVEIERSWSIPEGASAAYAFDRAEAHGGDEDAEEARGPFRPNDPYYRHQWHLDQIQMPDAWTRNRGAGVVVAVIDTGVAYRDHGRFRRAPDLAQTRIVPGYDFVDRDAEPDDEHGHGTHVAGTIAQSTNNGVGVAGVAPGAAIMPIRVLDRNGAGSWGGVAAGIRWAADNGAHVINMSLGGPIPSRAIARAIEHAHKKGVVVVAAAGNASRARVDYPAMYPHVIAVGAVRYDEALSFYSSYGRGLDIVAPGGDLRVDQNGDGLPDGVLQNTILRGDPSRHDYVAWQGTSMAAPHVAGVAALIRAGGVRDPDSIERILTRTAKTKQDRKRYASGLVQAETALKAAEQGLGGARGLAAAGFGLLVLLGLRRRQRLSVGFGSAIGVGVLLAGGLAVLPWAMLGGAGAAVAAVAAGAPAALAGALGPWGAPLALSALVPVLSAAAFLHSDRLRPVAVGTGIAFAGFLMVEALFPTSTFALLGWWAAGPWLVVNALLCAGVAHLAARRARA